jgi:tetratricopeptide (TPR) repeat protein
MKDVSSVIESYMREIEQTLETMELSGKLKDALANYQEIRGKLEALGIKHGDRSDEELQRTLAFCLMREANILRQTGRLKDAQVVTDLEMDAARSSGDPITLGRSLMSNGATYLLAGQKEIGNKYIEEARSIFEDGDSFDHKQGLGWYWIMKADLINKGIIQGDHGTAIDAASKAIEILLPIKNWPGVVRAYEARAKSYDAIGDASSAKADRASKAKYEEIPKVKDR